jgi:hypothetical protein
LIHYATQEFWEAYKKLPTSIKQAADTAFALLKSNPRHPSIRLKKVGNLWSARVGLAYRALAADSGDGLVWFWIGTHAEYDKLVP